MSVDLDSANKSSEDATNVCKINPIDLVAEELYSLLDNSTS